MPTTSASLNLARWAPNPAISGSCRCATRTAIAAILLDKPEHAAFGRRIEDGPIHLVSAAFGGLVVASPALVGIASTLPDENTTGPALAELAV
jgi:hypothetical protein